MSYLKLTNTDATFGENPVVLNAKGIKVDYGYVENRGLYYVYNLQTVDYLEANKEMIAVLKAHNAVKDGDIVIITKGDLKGTQGGTNLMKIVRVGELVEHTA